MQNLVNTTMSNHGKLDILASKADVCGTLFKSQISTVDYDKHKRVFDVNVFGAFACAKHAARVMVPFHTKKVVQFSHSVLPP